MGLAEQFEKISLNAKIIALMGVMVDLGNQVEVLKQRIKEIEEHENEKS